MNSTRIDQDDAVPLLRISGLPMMMVLWSALSLWSPGFLYASDRDESAEAVSHTVEKPIIKPLLSDQTLRSNNWVFISKQKDSKLADTWTMTALDDDPVLICRGAPYGYLRTKQQFADFEMELEWKFPADENGNSGILLHTSDEDRIWPKAIQVQLHQPVAGSIFPSGDAKTDNEIRDVRDLAKPVNQWNACRISSKGGTISVEMNGKKVGEVTGCLPNKGWIALQSEGSEIHFRRIRIRELPPAPESTSPDTHTGWFIPGHSWLRGEILPAACCLMSPSVSWSGVEETLVPGLIPKRRRTVRSRKASYVVYRDPLATDAHSSRSGDGLWLDVGRTSSTIMARRGDRLRRVDRRRLGL